MKRPAATAILLAGAVAACAGPPAVPPPEPGRPRELQAPHDEPPPGVFHRVLGGQTLFTIARTYSVSVEQVVDANGIGDPHRIGTDALLFIPGVEHILEVPITVVPVPGGRFLLPTDGPVRSGFGPRNGRMHYGLDLGAPAGAKVRAARSGTVLYAGSGYRGYGKLVILDHGDGFRTLYAHNRSLRTRSGRHVRAGEVIADVGASGNATGPHLHFEIRFHDRPVNPAPYLSFRP